jgi:hypothetical protein
MKSWSIGARITGTLLVAAAAGGCGGGRAGSAPTPDAGPLSPIIAREASPDPVPTLDAACDQEVTATEARPVTATTVGHYYIENGGLVYLVFLRGSPGWYSDLRDWQIPATLPSQHVQSVDIAGFRYALTLDAGTRSLRVLDERVDLRRSNVVFLDRVGNDVVVRGGELLNLCWSSLPDAVGQVLSRSRSAVTFVTGAATPPPKPPPVRTQTPTRRPGRR